MLLKRDKNDVKTVNLNNFDLIGIKQESIDIWTIVAFKEVLVPVKSGFLFWRKIDYQQKYIEHLIWKCSDRETALSMKEKIDRAWSSGYACFVIQGKS